MTTLAIFGGPLKRDVIKRAYAMCGRNVLDGELDDEDYYKGLLFLNDAAAEIQNGWGVALGYNFPADGSDGSGAEESGLSPQSVTAVAGEVAKRLAAMMGRQLAAEFYSLQAKAMSAMVSAAMAIPQMEMGRGTPRGAGNRYWGGPLPNFITDISDGEPVQ